ncbi:hypothetical protein ACI2KT_19180 [Ensifer adhaerens]|uniref:hypothetical protein n=1 Tax=Ensifer adhaerens TaxID=106592 RepID=UPI003850EB09
MTDLVERLRDRANDQRPMPKPYNLLLDAAEEIERLRLEIAEAAVGKTSIDKLLAALKRAEDAEDALAQARAALEWIAARDDRNGSLPEAYRKKIDQTLAACHAEETRP